MVGFPTLTDVLTHKVIDASVEKHNLIDNHLLKVVIRDILDFLVLVAILVNESRLLDVVIVKLHDVPLVRIVVVLNEPVETVLMGFENLKTPEFLREFAVLLRLIVGLVHIIR